MRRFPSRLYTTEKIRFGPDGIYYERDPNGFLYSGGTYPTKIRRGDLPEWYIHGRYYKNFGYLSAKGITDMVYVPSLWSNHYLKDDCLILSYSGRLTKKETTYTPDRFSYENNDEMVWGNAILEILKGAREYSGFDIEPFAIQIEEKLRLLKERFPEQFGSDSFDVRRYLSEPIYRPREE